MLDSQPGSLGGALRKLLDNGFGALQNRAELAAVEFKEEKDHAIEIFIWLTAALFFATITVVVLSATLILIFPDELRVYAAAGLTIIYLVGALWAFSGLKSRLKNRNIPFSATIDELKKDRE